MLYFKNMSISNSVINYEEIEKFYKTRLERFNKINNLAHVGVKLRHATSKVVWEITQVKKIDEYEYKFGANYQITIIKLKSLNSNKTKQIFLNDCFYMYNIFYVPPVIKALYG